jgi:hypothetical protein
MYPVKTATAVPGLPPYSEDGTPGFFTKGDAVAAILATVPGQDWFNMTQEELLNVIRAAGLTPSATDDTQLRQAIAALIANAMLAGTTPPQFDTTKKVATTEFVQRAGLQSSGQTTITTSAAIGVSCVGGLVLFGSASAIAPTLPLANSVPAGARIQCLNIGLGKATVTRSGADNILTSSNVSTVALGFCDSLILESNGSSTWFAIGGSVQLGVAAAFAASLGMTGRRRLPSGDLEQWGYAFATGVPTTVTFPLAFSEIFGVYTGINSAISVNGSATINSMATTGFTFTGWVGGAQSTNSTMAIYWRAIGK